MMISADVDVVVVIAGGARGSTPTYPVEDIEGLEAPVDPFRRGSVGSQRRAEDDLVRPVDQSLAKIDEAVEGDSPSFASEATATCAPRDVAVLGWDRPDGRGRQKGDEADDARHGHGG